MQSKRRIGFEIRTLTNLIKRQLDFDPIDVKVTRLQGWTIGYLYMNQDKELFQRDIEAEFNIRRSTATGLLTRMEKNGLIRRESVEHDARLKKLVLTEKAKLHHNLVREEIDRLEQRLAEGLSEEEIEIFFSITAKIKKNIE